MVTAGISAIWSKSWRLQELMHALRKEAPYGGETTACIGTSMQSAEAYIKVLDFTLLARHIVA